MKNQIDDVIRALEAEQDILVLYACESGSRAWGFASPDSDYDLRFIYAHPKDWYLRLEKQRDVIDLMLPNDLDLSGWDLRKTLRLFATCNLALNEWLDSPEVYWQAEGFRDELRRLIPEFFNPRKSIHHYLSMARSTAEENFDGRRIKIKKLFYILRPLFTCHWIEQRQSMPPTLFQTLLDAGLASTELLNSIDDVRSIKVKANEAEVTETPPIIYNWIRDCLRYFESIEQDSPVGNATTGWDSLNALMRKWTRDY